MDKPKSIDQKDMDRPKLTLENFSKGMAEVYRKMVIFKRQKNSPLVVMKDGEIIEINPFDAPDTVEYVREK